MRALLIVLLSFISLKAEKSSWYVGGSFLIGQGEQQRIITSNTNSIPLGLSPIPSIPLETPPKQETPKPQEPKKPDVSSSSEPLGQPQPSVSQPQQPNQQPNNPPQSKQPQHKSAPEEQPKSAQPQSQEQPEPQHQPQVQEPEPAEEPQPPQAQHQAPVSVPSSKKPKGRSEDSGQNPPLQNKQEQEAKAQYETEVETYKQQKSDSLDAAMSSPQWTTYQKYCQSLSKGATDGTALRDCQGLKGVSHATYESQFNKIFGNEPNFPQLPTCPIPQNFPFPNGTTSQSIQDYYCYGVGANPNIFQNMAQFFIRHALSHSNSFISKYATQSLNTTTSKQTTLHYGVSLAIGYKHFFVPRFGLRTYANIEYLYTNAYFSNSNILYGGGLDFLANIIDNNDKQSMIFGIFAGVNLAGNTSIAQIKDNHVSNTQFNTFLHTGLRFVFNGMHEFDLGVKVPFLKNPSVSLNTSNKLYEVQNNTLYSMFISYYYLF
ncbi:outer membrane beta-barrel protein [Helicobacter cetorum]|uniref:Outer membrane protein HopK n=1 Tax=Helicobacter cetorum (strain ATCC BAA-540 / CCUG 52418 / MIT 99-5656) TaxID=1163745 RepID=I0EQ77_HELCM|nr:outer membrane beta-barrel protein [Helicobacter cetorum]AFI05096.1 outer membrane protein HopK [Helicobacter cetorum MIT 99-5656]